MPFCFLFIFIFIFNVLFILNELKPPSRKILGLSEVRSITVDSIPKLQFPPSKIISLKGSSLDPKSLSTWIAFVGLNCCEMFALGATTGKLTFSKNFRAIGLLGSLTATVFKLALAIVSTEPEFL